MLRRGRGNAKIFSQTGPQISGVVFREGASRNAEQNKVRAGAPAFSWARSRLMPEWMASGTLAFLLALAGGFAVHYTLLTLGVMH